MRRDKMAAMGLEGVELVMEVEDEFAISISDEAAQQAVTVGDLYNLVLRLVRESETSPLRGRADLEEHVWSRVQFLAAQNGHRLRSKQVTRQTRFIEDLGYG